MEFFFKIEKKCAVVIIFYFHKGIKCENYFILKVNFHIFPKIQGFYNGSIYPPW